jgi:beta-glucosidase
MESLKFPDGFLWGAGTSSYQIEGAWNADGKGESIWDTFCRIPGKIVNGDTGEVACDHYHRWQEDIKIMKQIGLPCYRFSIAWPRILPTGRGKVNPAGLDFYSRLVDGLLGAGILPCITLYHWDLPQLLQDQGGWPERATADAFVEYADVVSRKLGDRVTFWSTLNEPFVSAFLGYFNGEHAPGHTSGEEMLRAAHHLLLGHGLAVPVLRANAPGAQVGIVLNLYPNSAASPSGADQAAARFQDGLLWRLYVDPLAGRDYPADVIEKLGIPLDFVQPDDLQEIAAPLDFLGVNYYSRHVVRSKEIPEEENLPVSVIRQAEQTEMGWEVHPPGLYETLLRLGQEAAFPALYITENGAAYDDQKINGQVDDAQRISYLQRHLHQVWAAIEAGVPVKGYIAWSLMDNFEWARGYSRRFGLVHVDYETQERTFKRSADWYRQVIQRNSLTS